MFSDVSEDEDFLDFNRIYSKQPYWPHLQLYEDDVFDVKRLTEEKVHKQVEEGIPQEEIVRDDHYRLYETLRFFKSFEGFHKGYLDLTGRHMPRYQSLIRRMKELLEDFRDLSLTVDVEERERTRTIAGRSYTHTFEHYTMKEPNKWDNFVKKWHVCRSGYGDLKDHVKDTMEVMTEFPYPKFQELRLVDLPEEILDLIFTFADLDKARLLSATCHKLREIGRPYIFMTRSLTLDLPSDFWTKRTENMNEAEFSQLLIETLKTCKTELLDQAAFLMGRPDLMDVITKLWPATPAKEHGAALGDDFYQPIYHAFADVIHNCKNLTDLTFCQVDFSVEIFKALVSLPRLLILDIHSCSIPESIIIGIFTGAITPSSSVLNLVLYETCDPGFEIWAPVLLFPNLRSLSVRRSSRKGLAVRPPELLQIEGHSSKVLSSLERLHVTSIDNRVVISLRHWIELNTAEATLKLTHLKLSAEWGLAEHFLLQLLDALRDSPLQVLVLDGIKEGSLGLFDSIAANCPNLLGLTVFRRENMRQTVTKPATWPHTTYEYAVRFSAFQRLEHFCWNFRVPRYIELTPAFMLYIEQGFISPQEVDAMYSVPEDSDEEDYFKDGYYAAYPFAAHCPTLKSFSINTGNLSDVYCYIKRRDNGSIELLRVDIWRDSNAYSYFKSWDLGFLARHWPHIVPKSNSRVEEVE